MSESYNVETVAEARAVLERGTISERQVGLVWHAGKVVLAELDRLTGAAPEGEPWCNHDEPALRLATVCECGAVQADTGGWQEPGR